MVTRAELDALLGQEITRICPVGYSNRNDNHCAHFVSHVLGVRFGFLCSGMVGGGRAAGATIRVHELFPHCGNVGNWDAKPAGLMSCLIFITKASNVNLNAKSIDNVPRKHVGIFVDGDIWHYSNTRDKVVRQTPEEFSHHYPAPHDARFFGEMP
jgi:hypothetical protein